MVRRHSAQHCADCKKPKCTHFWIQIFASFPGQPQEEAPRPTTQGDEYYGIILPVQPEKPVRIRLVYNREESSRFNPSTISLNIASGLRIINRDEGQDTAAAIAEELQPGTEVTFDVIHDSENVPILTQSQPVTLTLTDQFGTIHKDEVKLGPIEFEVKHTEIDLATGQAVNPGADTMLRDEIVDIRIKVPPMGNTDWTVDLSIEPEAMRTHSLPNRGNVQMYDFGQIETNGTVTPDKTQFVLQTSAGGERTIRAVFNKEGEVKVKMKSTDGKIDFTSPEYTIQKRIRKYANLPSSQNHDLNQHDQAFIDAAAHWGGVYQHPVDDVERLKAMGMAESELGLTDATDIMTVGNPGDHVLDTFRNVPPYDRFPGVAPLGGLALREVDIANNTTKMLSYPAADETPAATAIHWGVCWLYQKASSIQNNPNPPQPPDPPNPYIPGPWRSWDTATERYNGGGVPNYLQRINRSMKEGRHPSNANLYIWPLKSNKKARGNQ